MLLSRGGTWHTSAIRHLTRHSVRSETNVGFSPKVDIGSFLILPIRRVQLDRSLASVAGAYLVFI
jgi:hypothetical protein